MTEAKHDQGQHDKLTMHRSIPHMFSILVRFKHPSDSSGTFASNSPSSQSSRSKYEYHLTRMNLDIQTREREATSQITISI